MRNFLRCTFIVSLVFLCLNLQSQDTPLGTPATQNADGTTATPGTPAACAAGSNIYTIDHDDASLGFLPGGFCVSTDQVNNGTTPITITGTPTGPGIGDVDNIVVGGGRINYSSTDGGDLDATYNFCSTVTNPYVFIGDLETFTTINFFDCSGNPVNINLMNGQSRFATSGNSALITGTTSTNQDGYVQVPGTFDCLVININNPAPFTLDVIQIAVGVCMPDPPAGNMVCPYDLMLWKKDDYCVPVYMDAEGTVYEKDQNNNNIASLGDGLFSTTPICGTLELLESDAIDDLACEPIFACPSEPKEIQFYEPAGTGCLYSTYWYDITNFSLNDSDPGNQWSAIFSGTDGFGLPAHPSTPTNAAENCGLEWLGDNEGDIDFDDEAGGANEDEQLQLDGWLYVANHLECIRFRIGSSATDHSVGLYLGPDLNNMTLVTDENDEQAGGSNNTNGVEGSYCIPAGVSTTIDSCGWKILRVRIYAHDDDTAYDPAVDWSFNGGLTWDVVEEQWFVAATSASDNTPPVGVGPSGMDPMVNCLVDTGDVLVDADGKVWPQGSCAAIPTNLYEPNVPNGGTCFGDANAEEGDHFSLMPYCVVFADVTTTCEVCCELVVDCSAITDQTLACRADLPPVDFDLPMVVDSCGDVIRSALTIIPGNAGCPGDTLTITRTYFLQDTDGNMEECMQTFTMISENDPTFTFCPADTSVVWNTDLSPAALGMATGEGECHPASPQATVTFNDVTTPGACPNDYTITRTWTLTDRCMRSVTKDQIITVTSTLDVDCSLITDQTLACRADLPSVDFDLPMVIDSCGDVIRSALTIIPGNSGCPGDEVTITRTYFLQDQAGNMAECMQTFTVISTMDPSFSNFPADAMVECGGDTSPAATGTPVGVQECNFSSDAVVTFNDVVTPGACPAEMTITRTWTVTDDCGRMVSMDQVINVVDTTPPVMVCQDVTIQLDDMGNASVSADQVNNGSTDNCGGPVSLVLDMTAFTCDNIGANTVTLTGTDECGNMATCQATVTVEDNVPPVAVCQDVTLSLDDNGNATIVLPDGSTLVDNGSTDNCTPADELLFSVSVGAFSCADIPLGQASVTIPVTMTVTDAEGNSSECPANVTIMDDTPPVVDCPEDIFVQLESGECEEIVFFDIPFTDNCGAIDAEASQAINEMLINDALDCLNNTSNHLRYFNNLSPVPVEITQVNMGIFNAGATETVEVNIYSIAPGATFVYANMTLEGTTDYMVPAGMNQSILPAMVEATIPVGMDYVLELKANNTTNFVIGYNNQGETGSTYISGNPPVPCVSLEPTDIDGLGFGAFAVILYSNAEGGPTIEQTSGLPSGSYFPVGTTTNTFVVTDVNGNSTECTFDVNMVEYSNGVTGTLACNDNINVSLDMDCEVVLDAGMLLEGGAYGCYQDFIIEVSGGVLGNVITQEGTYTVTITDPDTGNSCWSTINVEDKRAPMIDCACPEGGVEIETPFVGTLDADDPTFTRPFVGGAGCAPSGVGVDVPYDTYTFSLDMDAGVDAEVVSFSAPSGDSFLALYQDSFDPADPCGNLVITNDDGGAGFLSAFSVMLETGVNYILVVTTFNNNGNDFGDYVVEMTSDARFLELQEECNFRCVDVEYILGSDDLTVNPSITSCSDYEAYFTDELTVDANGNQIILRTWLAVNDNGSSTCVQQFNIAPLTIADLTLPVNPVELSCNDGVSPEEIVAIFDNPLTTDNPNTSYVENNEGYVYAYPTYLINGHPQKVDNFVCDIYATYTDQELDACEEGCNGNRKVIRTWTLLDWSTLEIVPFVQTIKAVDTEAPTLITEDVTVSTDPWGCDATFPAPLPWELHDNCDYAPRYTINTPAGVGLDGSFEEGYTIVGAPKGVHTFSFVAYDCCGNEASYPFTVTVVDATPPVVVAKQNVVISLTSGSTSEDGLAKLYAESLDNGSYDGCSNSVKLEVRRDGDVCDVRGNATYNADGHPQDGSPNPNSPSYDPDGGAYVKFCCEDLTNATVDVNGDGENDPGYVKVWLRVWDDGDMDGFFGTAGDNYNEAWAFVKVEDKLAPAIQCPADVTLTCDMDYTDLNMTGSATAFGSCGGVDVEYNDIIINLNSCNEGFVRRRWNVVGRSDIFCDQTITLEDLDAPVNVSFSQVQDFTAANCPDMIALGEPTWIAGPCDVLGYQLETDTFFFEDGACYKLVNHWTVINWCEYDPNNPFWNGEGLWEHTQVIKVTDETKPVIEDCEDKMFAINDNSDSDDDGEVCEAKIVLTNVATDEGSENCPTGWLKWQVFVDLWADGTNDLEYSSFLPPFDSNLNNDTNGNGINDRYVSPTANGETVSIPLPDIVGSMSNHKVSWKVTDGCNNVTTCDYDFMVVDKKAPTPYCVDLSTAVMESSGTVELWAIDFNVGSFDNCTAQEDLRYTFTDVAPEDDPNYDPAQRSSSKVFTCADVDNSPVEVNMYVWDEKGNADFCLVYLTIVDNTGACDGTNRPDIAGQITNEQGSPVEDVETTLESTLPEYPKVEMSDEAGSYAFYENPMNMNYAITASKDVDYLNGVSTLDLVKIQRHLLGLETLSSPYKLIAADVNADDAIKASDLTQLRKLILGVIAELPTNESWRFVDAAQALTMDTPLADVDYVVNINDLQSDMMSGNMVAVKIGDVTENATTNLQDQQIEVRSSNVLTLTMEEQTVEAGETFAVGFTSEDFENVFGYQFTMELNGLTFAGIESGAVVMQEANVGMLSENVITMSYSNSEARSAQSSEAIFTVSFTANKSGNVSEMIELTSKVTPAEAYVSTSLNTDVSTSLNTGLEIRDVVIESRGAITAVDASELYQNEPNPFKTQTVVGFNLAEAGKASLTVFDATGKVIVKKNIDGVKGYNSVNLTANQLGTSGVLYYTLESGDYTASKKMIIIE